MNRYPIERERVAVLNRAAWNSQGAFVLYWMQQAQRAEGNHALEYAIALSNAWSKPLLVLFALTESYPGANARHYWFMLEGLEEVARTLARRGIPFACQVGDPTSVVPQAAGSACAVVTDRGYMPIQKKWREAVAQSLSIPLVQVESDVVVPVDTVSDHEEYAARTIRPKIHRLLPQFLKPVPRIELNRPWIGKLPISNDWTNARDLFQRLEKIDRSVGPVKELRGGISEARRHLADFIEHKLPRYVTDRNDPNLQCHSRLSPYLHFGQISVLEVALAAKNAAAPRECKEAFLEELIVRRELSMNLARYRPDCERYSVVPDWAQRTLGKHAADRRPYVYSKDQLEAAATQDPYWNAAQMEMRKTGFMHNYMRMYWGKKIIEWTRSPEEAYEIALHLNNKYQLDGRDPNSCAGVAWCFGKHDRPWPERPIFGKVRYMSGAALVQKFDMERYRRRWLENTD